MYVYLDVFSPKELEGNEKEWLSWVLCEALKTVDN